MLCAHAPNSLRPVKVFLWALLPDLHLPSLGAGEQSPGRIAKRRNGNGLEFCYRESLNVNAYTKLLFVASEGRGKSLAAKPAGMSGPKRFMTRNINLRIEDARRFGASPPLSDEDADPERCTQTGCDGLKSSRSASDFC